MVLRSFIWYVVLRRCWDRVVLRSFIWDVVLRWFWCMILRLFKWAMRLYVLTTLCVQQENKQVSNDIETEKSTIEQRLQSERRAHLQSHTPMRNMQCNNTSWPWWERKAHQWPSIYNTRQSCKEYSTDKVSKMIDWMMIEYNTWANVKEKHIGNHVKHSTQTRPQAHSKDLITKKTSSWSNSKSDLSMGPTHTWSNPKSMSTPMICAQDVAHLPIPCVLWWVSNTWWMVSYLCNILFSTNNLQGRTNNNPQWEMCKLNNHTE